MDLVAAKCFSFNETRLKPLNYPHLSSSYHPSTETMPSTTILQKLRNLQINLAQGRTQQQLSQAEIFISTSNSSSQR
ncbi:unnamed protein product [Rotaria sordida]|uniref:Uncharacterized protein n=1 Tax=Rotaria sordida TaxID=392033 RepID=A0A818JPB8_9BILA|nr:unnamed protein product [Rotaria sordida]